MRIAILADIHANLLALEAVIADLEIAQPDQVIVAGDFQNRGPAPKEVYDRLRKFDWPLLRGNHEDYVIEQSESPTEQAHAVDLYAWQPARWTAERVPETIPFLRTLPIAIHLSGPDGSFICIAHGSPRSKAEGFFVAGTRTCRCRDRSGQLVCLTWDQSVSLLTEIFGPHTES